MTLNRPPDEEPLFPKGMQPAKLGCGCMLPGSGMLLLGLTILLAFVIGRNTTGFSPLWLILVPLIVGIMVLFVRVHVSRPRH